MSAADKIAQVLAEHVSEDHYAGNGYNEPREAWVVCSCGADIWEWQQFYNENPADPEDAFRKHLAAVVLAYLLAEVERLEREKALVRQAYEEKIGYLAKETRRAYDMQLLAEKFASQEAEAHTRAEEAMQKVAEAWDEGRHFGQTHDHAYPHDNPYKEAP